MILKIFWTLVFIIGGGIAAKLYLRKFGLSKALNIFIIGGIMAIITIVVGMPMFSEWL